MAVAVRNSTQANAASAAVAPAIPTGTTTGDVMVAAFQAASTSAGWTGPTGWTLIPGTNQNGLAIYWRAWVSGDAAPSASPAPSSASSAVCISFSGADPLTPFDFGSVLAVAASATYNTAAFYNNITGSLFCCIAGGSGQTSFTEQVSITEDQDVNTTGRAALMVGHEAATLTAGTQAARTVTASGSNSGSVVAIAIRPAEDPSIAVDSLLGAADSTLSTSATTTPNTLAHTVGLGANRILIVTLKCAVTQAGAPTTAKWTQGGVDQALTLLDSNNTSPALYLYYLLAPNAGAGTITFVLQTSSRAEYSVQSFANVHQTTPFRTGQVSGNVAGTTTHLFTTTATPSVTVATKAGDWAVDATGQAAANTLAMTAVTSRTQTDNSTTTSLRAGGSVMITPSASQALAWTYGGSAAQSTIAVALVQDVPMKPGTFLSQAVKRTAVF